MVIIGSNVMETLSHLLQATVLLYWPWNKSVITDSFRSKCLCHASLAASS